MRCDGARPIGDGIRPKRRDKITPHDLSVQTGAVISLKEDCSMLVAGIVGLIRLVLGRGIGDRIG